MISQVNYIEYLFRPYNQTDLYNLCYYLINKHHKTFLYRICVVVLFQNTQSERSPFFLSKQG